MEDMKSAVDRQILRNMRMDFIRYLRGGGSFPYVHQRYLPFRPFL